MLRIVEIIIDQYCSSYLKKEIFVRYIFVNIYQFYGC